MGIYNKSINWPSSGFPKILKKWPSEYHKLSNPFIVYFLTDAVGTGFSYLLAELQQLESKIMVRPNIRTIIQTTLKPAKPLAVPQVSSIVIILMYCAPTKFLWTHAQ